MRLQTATSVLALALAVSNGCAGTTAEAPLTMSLGGTRAATAKQLRSHEFCHRDDGPPGRYETFPRCERPGPEWGESWVTAVFDGDKLIELRRWERFTDDNRAVERWNQLVGERMKIAPASDEALQTLRAEGLLQLGTRTVKAFRDGNTVIGVYLLTPTPPEDAAVLEKIVTIPAR